MNTSLLILTITVLILFFYSKPESFLPSYPEPIMVNSYCKSLGMDCCQNPYDCEACREGVYYRHY